MNWRRYLGRDVAACVVLGLVTLALFSPLQQDEFLFFDDPSYVTENPRVSNGISMDGIVWAFTHFHSGNWHPLTWISLMSDAQLYHLNASGFVATNVLLHAASALVLFFLLRGLTGAFWRSLTVAGLFAWHPLHVESVAWISERKDVLSGFFWMLTLCAYSSYSRSGSRRSYIAALVCFAAGLMSKAMLVTLPCVFLLLDFWPLRRLQPAAGGPGRVQFHSWLALLREKCPFFLLAALGSIVTFAAQKSGASVTSMAALPLSLRIGHSLTSYIDYLVKTIWPSGLSIFYPYPEFIPLDEVLVAVSVLLVISVAVVRLREKQPWLIVGWFWYLGTLVPVIGLVQVGVQSIADRYTYIPLIGVFLAVVWAGPAFFSMIRLPIWCGHMAAGMALAGCLIATSRQIPYWRNTEAVFARSLAINPANLVALTNLGAAAADEHQYGRAAAYYQAALRLNPGYLHAANGFCKVLILQGRFAEALERYRLTIQLHPEHPDALLGAAALFVQMGREVDAIPLFEKALQLRPDDGDHWFNLGNLYLRHQRTEDSIKAFTRSIEANPGRADAHLNLAVALQSTGRGDDAAGEYEAALRLQPNLSGAHFEYGALLLKRGKVDSAERHFQESIRVDASDFRGFLYLGLLRAGQHRDAEAIGLLRSAVRLAPEHPDALRVLSWLLSTSASPVLRNGAEALQLARKAVAGSPQNPATLDALAAAQAEAGQFDAAVQTAQNAAVLARELKQPTLAEAIGQHSQNYRAGKPWRENTANAPSSQ